MATRFYLPSAGPAPVTPPALPSGWIAGSTAALQAPAPTAKSNTALTEFIVAETTASTTNVAVGVFVSEPLGAQTIAGDITAVIRAYGTIGSGNDDALQVGAYLISGDGTTVKQTLYAGHTAALQATTATGQLGQEFTSTGGAPGPTRIIPAQAMTSQSADAGDRLMLIVGYRTYDVSAGARDSELRFGDPAATADQALTAGLTTDLVPWVELSADLAFDTGDPEPAEGTADMGLALAVSAAGGRPSEGLAQLATALTVAATGARPSTGTAAFALALTAAASGSAPDVDDAGGSAAFGLALDLAVTGARPSSGTANFDLALALASVAQPGGPTGVFPPIRTTTSAVPIRTATIR